MRTHSTDPDSVVGKKFGRFTVRDLVFRGGRSYCVCVCECGTVKDVRTTRIKCGRSKSCGCYQRDHSATVNRTHGRSRTETYRLWKGMLNRCASRRNKNYGGRGIKVCKRWRRFENFLADMGERPEGKSIDRYPDNNGNYEPGNCRWATEAEQKRNTSRNRPLTLNGETLVLVDWAKRIGVSTVAIVTRLARGWSVERALTTPRRKQHVRSDYNLA